MPTLKPILEMKNVTKRFNATTALSNVSFDLFGGEVHCLVGENGAGKSTLIKTLAGSHQADEGKILLNGEETKIRSPLDGLRQGVGVVYQELELIPDLTVAENIMMGIKSVTHFGLMKWKELYKQAEKVLEETGLSIKIHTPVRELSVAQSQLVAIAKVLAQNPQIIVLDEPSAVLAGRDLELLFSLIERLKKKGTGIVYISHRLEEIFQIGDRITVLRDGHIIATHSTKEVTENQLIQLMVGREVENRFPARVEHYSEDVLFEVNQLNTEHLKNIDFKVHKGEIFGVAGLIGAGQNDLAKALYGLMPVFSGSIVIDGSLIKSLSPRHFLNSGISLVPESRKTEGLVLMHSILDNLTYSVLKNYTRGGLLQLSKLRKIAQQYKEDLSIKTSTLLQSVGNLSGGNQQKVVMAKALSTAPKLLILNEPTRGVDVGAKAEFYQLIVTLAKEGHGIILISSELAELTALSHRIAVMSEGEIRAIVEPEFDEREILRYALPKEVKA